MTFEVTACGSTGAKTTFRREAESRAALLLSLRAEHVVVIAVEEVRETRELPPWFHPGWLRPMTSFDVEIGLRQLASMLRSGITLLQALATVAEQAATLRAKRTWLEVKDAVFRGGTFSEALARHQRRFGEIVVRLTEIGERSGELESVVTKGADQLEARRNLRTQVINALVYPLLAITMAIGVSAFLVVAVIPKVAAFLQSGGAQLPAMTQSLIDLSEWVAANGITILVSVAGVIAAWILVRLTKYGHELEDVFLLRIPITGRILRLSGTALFARSMEIMTSSGVTLLDSLATAAGLLANYRLRRRVIEAREEVVRGISLADSLKPAVEFLPMLRKMAAVGEMSGSLPETFGETARFHEMLLAIAVKRFGMLVEPVMIVITGLIVGYVYVAFFMAIFAMAGAS